MINVYDNFLPSYYFKQLQSFVMSEWFNWYWNDGVSYKEDEDYQFIHFFYRDNPDEPTDTFSHIEPCISYFNMKKIYRIKANLRSKTIFHRKSLYHTDGPEWGPHKTAILYMNTCNGYTKFKKGGKVKSVENRVVIFDSDLEHAGVTCTDEKRRVVVNFNYEV